MSVLGRIKHKLVALNYRRNYYLAKLLPPKVPATPLHYLPQGFSVTQVADTGLKIVDNFCTQEEADYLIGKAQAELQKDEQDVNTLADEVRALQEQLQKDDPRTRKSLATFFFFHAM